MNWLQIGQNRLNIDQNEPKILIVDKVIKSNGNMSACPSPTCDGRWFLSYYYLTTTNYFYIVAFADSFIIDISIKLASGPSTDRPIDIMYIYHNHNLS